MEQQPWGVGEYLSLIAMALGAMYLLSRLASWIGGHLGKVSSDYKVIEPAATPEVLSTFLMTVLPPRYLELVSLRLHAQEPGTDAGTEPGTAAGTGSGGDIKQAGLTDGQRDMLDALVRQELRIMWASTGRTLNQEQLGKLLAVRKKTVGDELVAIRARIAEERSVGPELPPNPELEVPAYEEPALALAGR